MVYIITQFSVTYGSSEQQYTWVSAFDVERKVIVAQQAGLNLDPVTALKTVRDEYPDAMVVSINCLPAAVKTAFDSYNEGNNKFTEQMTKGW